MTRSFPSALSCAVCVWLCLPWAAIAAPGAPVLTLEDPRGDDRGPGSYLPPTAAQFRPLDFDLRRFTARVDGQDLVLEVTLGANLRRQADSLRTDSGPVELANGLSVQHVDIYVDTTPGEGFTSSLPGRRVAFAPEEAWDVAILLTPRPGLTRRVLDDWDREAARRVLTPGPLRTSGATVTARVPLAALGGAPKPTWGWSVMVSGARWEQSFQAVDRLRGKAAPDAFTVPVVGVPEELAFGGATVDGWHPYVIDVLLPAGRTQAQVLGDYGPGRPAVVPMIYAERPKLTAPVATAPASPAPRAPGLILVPSAPAPSPAPASDAASASAAPDAGAPPASRILEIASVQGDTAVIPTPGGGLSPWQIGVALDAQDRQIGRVVVTTVSNGFVLVSLAEGKELIRPGTRVRFGSQLHR